MSEWSVYLTGKFQQWLPKMPGDILTFWIEGFSLMELVEACVNTGIPRSTPDVHRE
jgi:hypothetical protein